MNSGPWQPKGQGPRNPNPWGGGGNKGGGGGGNEPPDLEEILRRSQERLRGVMQGGGGGGGISRLGGMGIAFLGLIAVIGWMLTGFYTIRPNEVGIERVFGKFISLTAPGLNWNWPYPVGRIDKPTIGVQTVEVGFRTVTNDGRRGGPRDAREESLMLTGDENIVDVDFSILWLVDARKPQDFVFNLKNPEGTVRAVAESAMREIIGRREIQPILTGARLEIERQVQELMQKTLNAYGAGIIIQQVQMMKVDPPNEVISAFRDVQAARADQERMQNEAQTYANKVVPEARGDASKITQRAEAERERMIADARGEAARFTSILDEYQKAPQITRQRLYIESIERIYGGMDKIILDDGQGGGGVLPFLPLNEMLKNRAREQGKK